MRSLQVRDDMLFAPAREDARRLLQRAGCTVTFQDGVYTIHFPDGTFEQDIPETPFRHQSKIQLPNGVALQKWVLWPCLRAECNHTKLVLPGAVEPLHRRQRRF